ncbi:recombinase family protein [Brassicibacter mesophilus]|uniref:recombinase family protein n=1 Tax=Brassicibacter mesophilus TaxID=745119 RepID=UPI003D1D4F96
MKVVAYCRVSTDSNDQKNSLEAQKKHYMQMFKEKGYDIADVGLLNKRDKIKEVLKGIYADEGITGTSAKNRDAFNQMIEDARAKRFDTIFVKNVTRWTRSVEDGTKALKDLKVLGVGVIFEDGNLNSLNPANEMVLNMLMSTAQEESRLKSSAIQFGIRKAQEQGKWNAGLPFGYDIESGYLKVNRNESDVIKEIYRLYLNEGYGSQKIARELNSRNIKTKKGVKWSQTQVARILENELYIGKQITHTVVTNDVNRKDFKKIPEDEQIINIKEELRIIDDETFKETQSEIKKRSEMFKKNNNRPSNKHLLSNILYCHNCKNAMKRKKIRTYRRKDSTSNNLGYEWVCRLNDMYGKDRCKYRNAIRESEVISFVKTEISKIKENKIDFNKTLDEYIEVNYSTDNLDSRKEELETILLKLKKQQKLNFELLAEEIIDKEEYQNRNDILREEIKEKESELNKLKYINIEIEKVKHKYNQYVKYLKEIDINNLSNAILKKIINKIHVYNIEEDLENKEIFENILDEFAGNRDMLENIKDENIKKILESKDVIEFLKLMYGDKTVKMQIEWNFLDTTPQDIFHKYREMLLKKK